MRHRHASQGPKRAERQIQTAGKLPFHRVMKAQKLLNRLHAQPKGKSSTHQTF